MRRFTAHRASARDRRFFSTFPAMSIPTGGLAALLVVATLALSSCGSDNASVTTTTTVSPGSGGTTATQTVAAETTPAQTTKPKTTTTQTTAPATTQKTQTTAPAPKPAKKKSSSSAPCPSVDVGVRNGDIGETYARVTSISGVGCETVTYVVQQWGGQRIGVGKALLPLGWSCSGSSCRKGSSSLSFVLEPPSNSD
jgi:hypothetical protein